MQVADVSDLLAERRPAGLPRLVRGLVTAAPELVQADDGELAPAHPAAVRA